MELEGEPYFLKNKEWYIVNEGIPKFLGGTVERYYTLTDKAPKEARSSYRKFYNSFNKDVIFP